jgi:hypothetical protein
MTLDRGRSGGRRVAWPPYSSYPRSPTSHGVRAEAMFVGRRLDAVAPRVAAHVTAATRAHPEGDPRDRGRRRGRALDRRLLPRDAPSARCVPVRGSTLRSLATKVKQEDLVALSELLEAGTVTQVIDWTYPLIEAPDAIRYWRKATHAARWSYRCLRRDKKDDRPGPVPIAEDLELRAMRLVEPLAAVALTDSAPAGALCVVVAQVARLLGQEEMVVEPVASSLVVGRDAREVLRSPAAQVWAVPLLTCGHSSLEAPFPLVIEF